jgi:hypothetical protein
MRPSSKTPTALLWSHHAGVTWVGLLGEVRAADYRLLLYFFADSVVTMDS